MILGEPTDFEVTTEQINLLKWYQLHNLLKW
jgi:hypothetical protein